MKASSKAYELIRRFEGKSNTAYQDSAGVWTIGYGHTGGVVKGQTISDDEVERLLAEDVAVAENAVNAQHLILTQDQFDALVDFVFNIGAGNFQKSTLLKKLKADPNDPTIYDEFLRWVYAGGVKLLGLVRRRTDEANLYFTGITKKKVTLNIY